MKCGSLENQAVKAGGIGRTPFKAVRHAFANVMEAGNGGCGFVGECEAGKSCGFVITQIVDISVSVQADYYEASVSTNGRCQCIDPTP
ncbi:hypothetical protein [Stappia sp.]|uniref:hypothetical protein n=1 Tax=Stappia sp. TaxID=1870903 RepID=UPI003D14FC14